MPVTLGSGALSDAWLQALQIVHLQAAFWLTLGVSLAAYESATTNAVAFGSGAATAHVSLNFFFGDNRAAATGQLVAAHAVQGVLFGVVVGQTLDRRALCPDAVGTATFLHVVGSCVKVGFPATGVYWVSLLLAAGLSLLVANWLAARREMAEIALPPSQDAEMSARPRV